MCQLSLPLTKVPLYPKTNERMRQQGHWARANGGSPTGGVSPVNYPAQPVAYTQIIYNQNHQHYGSANSHGIKRRSMRSRTNSEGSGMLKSSTPRKNAWKGALVSSFTPPPSFPSSDSDSGEDSFAEPRYYNGAPDPVSLPKPPKPWQHTCLISVDESVFTGILSQHMKEHSDCEM